MSQLRLLVERRFWPLFWTQFLGAFNDNVFKNALVIMLAYRAMSVAGIGSEQLVVACAGIFILPFFLFSATAGQLADRFSKSGLMRWVKLAEIGIMALGAVGFWLVSVPLLLAVLFLMGLQSTFFGPAKFSILPELLDERSLVGGNALKYMTGFMRAVTGWDRSEDELLKAGERIVNMRHVFNLREGINPLDYKVHPRIIGRPPLKDGPLAGVTASIEAQVYWGLGSLDWNRVTTVPSKKKLLELGLVDVAEEFWPPQQGPGHH